MLLFLALLSVAAQDSTGQPSSTRNDEFLKLAPLFLESAVEYADPTRDTDHGRPPLAVNLASFVVNGSMASFTEFTRDEVTLALGRPFVEGSPGKVSAALYVELNCFMMAPHGYEGVTTSQWLTRLRSGRLKLSYIVIRVAFVRENGGWTRKQVVVLSQT